MVPVSRGRHDVSVGWMWRVTPIDHYRSLIIDGYCRIWTRVTPNQTMVHHTNKSQSAKMTFFSLVEQALHTISGSPLVSLFFCEIVCSCIPSCVLFLVQHCLREIAVYSTR